LRRRGAVFGRGLLLVPEGEHCLESHPGTEPPLMVLAADTVSLDGFEGGDDASPQLLALLSRECLPGCGVSLIQEHPFVPVHAELPRPAGELAGDEPAAAEAIRTRGATLDGYAVKRHRRMRFGSVIGCSGEIVADGQDGAAENRTPAFAGAPEQNQ
jgi:hypothetical protein